MVSTRWASSALVKPLLKVRKKIRTLSIEEYSLLHAVDFRHRVETSILPALWAGKTVLADRYLFTALARDAARGLDLDWLLHAYSPLLWPDLVIYFSMTPEDSRRRMASSRAPHFYEAGQDVTGIDDPLASYGRFIDRVVKEYNNLSVVFQFVTVDAGEAVYRQHTRCASSSQGAEKRPWPTFSEDAVEEWLHQVKQPGALIAIDGTRGKDVRRRRRRVDRGAEGAPASSARSAAAMPRGCSASWRPASGDRHISIADAVARLRRRPRLSLALGNPPGARSRRRRDRRAVHRDRRRVRRGLRARRGLAARAAAVRAEAGSIAPGAKERKIDRGWKRRPRSRLSGILRRDAGTHRRRKRRCEARRGAMPWRCSTGPKGPQGLST